MQRFISPWRQAAIALASLVLVGSLFRPLNAAEPAVVSKQVPAAKPSCPPQFTRFVAEPTEPVFTAGPAGAWDARIRERGWILKEGPAWKLWYTGYDGQRDSIKRLGYATSQDGKTWVRSRENPIYGEHWTEDMMIVPHNGTYYMFAEGAKDRAQLLTSTDGLHWNRQGTLDIRYTDGRPLSDGAFGTPTAWVEGDTWYLLYERNDKGIWLAKSTDLKVWTHVQDEPVMSPGPAEYDEQMIAVNQVIKQDGVYYALYHGRGKATDARPKPPWSTGLATSRDRIHWQKCPANPLFPPAENKSSGVFVWDGERYLLYTMHDRVVRHVPLKVAAFNSPHQRTLPTAGSRR